MKNKIIRIAISVILVAMVFGIGTLAITKSFNDRKNANVISLNFIGYDFARAIIGDDSDISMLLRPGAEMHDFEPTAEDIINIKKADLFIYVGGESDGWVERMLDSNNISREKTLRLMDLIEAKVEENEIEDGDNTKPSADNKEYDEHIWTSPLNAIKLVDGIAKKLSILRPDNAKTYLENANAYNNQLLSLDQSFRDVVASGNKNELIFGDRFPFRYFVDEYGLNYYAAFSGCSEQTEASSKTIAFLVDKVKTDNIKIILKIELTSDKLARTIANESGAKVMELNSAHNISQEDFNRGITYIDIMKGNLAVLKEALE